MTDNCPKCGSDDLKESVATHRGKIFDYGCRQCGLVFDIE